MLFNLSLCSFAKNAYLGYQPYFLSSGNVKMNRIHFSKSFSSFFVGSGIQIHNGQFSFLLSTGVIISSISHYRKQFISYSSFSLENENTFSDCIFKEISTNSGNTAGILISNYVNVLIQRCGFYKLFINAATSNGAALYTNLCSKLVIKESCFDYCWASHGASYGIHTDHYEIPTVEIRNSIETRVGWAGSQGHSSYCGGRTSFLFDNNNGSHIISSGNAGVFYFLKTEINGLGVKYCHACNSKVTSLIFTWTGNDMKLDHFVFENCSVSSWFRIESNRISMYTCCFFKISPKTSLVNQNSQCLSFNECIFSDAENVLSFGSASRTLCIFSQISIPNPINSVNNKNCWALGELSTKSFRVFANSLNLYVLMLIFQ